jgi:hypothetical protein
MLAFCRAESAFYPQIAELYEARIQAWCACNATDATEHSTPTESRRIHADRDYAPSTPPALMTSRIHPRLVSIREELSVLLRLDDPTEIDAVLADLQTLVYRCLLHVRLATVHRKEIRGRGVRGKRARTTAAAPRKGRRRGAANFAARQLGLGLAFIWSEQTGRRPARVYDGALEIGRGDYRAFVQLVVDALPERLVRKHNGRLLEVDYMVRVSTRDFDAARMAPEDYRRRGLIEEGPWMRGASEADLQFQPMSH